MMKRTLGRSAARADRVATNRAARARRGFMVGGRCWGGDNQTIRWGDGLVLGGSGGVED